MLVLYAYLIFKYFSVFQFHFGDASSFDRVGQAIAMPLIFGVAGSSFLIMAIAALAVDIWLVGAIKSYNSQSVRAAAGCYIMLSVLVLFVEPWLSLSQLDATAGAGIMFNAFIAAKSWAGGLFGIIFCSIPYAYLWLRHL
ncbi:MAG: hypothetical protein HEP70_18565 [Rhodobiaceae bacterium]|jgi:hypothetical protein|nr:hypothetical protein [Rhodobiaceae bacterium]